MNQAAFARALLDPDQPIPGGLTGPQGGPIAGRFAVYRNNVTLGLTRALAQGFPSVARQLGADRFAELARAFLRRHPPSDPILMQYGGAFAGFLEGIPAIAPHMPDLARLDQALRESYHAADAPPLPQAALAALQAADPARLRLTLAPALRLLRSPWPVLDHWADKMPALLGQDVAILRPGFDPVPHALPPGGGAFLAAILAGHTLSEAAETAGPALDLPAVLAVLVSGGAIIGAQS